MLINSDGMKGNCPVCGTASCSCGGPTTVIAVDERTTKAMGGELIKVEIAPGRLISLTEEEAIRRGYLKKQEPALNKKLPVSKNKKG